MFVAAPGGAERISAFCLPSVPFIAMEGAAVESKVAKAVKGVAEEAAVAREKRIKALREKHRWAMLLAKRHCREIQRPILLHLEKPAVDGALQEVAQQQSLKVVTELVWPNRLQSLSRRRKSVSALSCA